MNGQQRFQGAQQRPFQYRSVKRVSTALRMVVEYNSTLQNVRLEREVEQTVDTSSSFYRDRSHLYDVELIPSTSRGIQSPDSEKLEKIQKELRDQIGRKGVDWWMETAVLYPIGPEQMQKIEGEGINLRGLSYKLLINHTNATALLAVKRRQTVEATTSIIETALSQLTDHQPVLLSDPNSGYAIQLSYGEEPKAIEDPCDTKYQFGYRTPQEFVSLFLKFDLGQERRDGVEITLRKGNKFAAKAFRLHYMEPIRINQNGEGCWRREGNWKKLAIDDFPCGFPTIESRMWLINRVIEANNIDVKSIQPYTKYLDDFMDRRHADLMEIVTTELRTRSHRLQDDASWRVARQNRGPNDKIEYVDIHFDQVTSGLNIVNSLLNSHNAAVFKLFDRDLRGAELTPCLRRTIVISRAIRVALDDTIRQFDYDLRTHFTKLTASQDPIMEQKDAEYYRIRIHEEWKDGSDVGLIGIEGWSPDAVREQFQKLEEILKPRAFGGCLQLLFGPGAVFAKSLERKYQGALLVELDKYTEEVKLIGDATGDAIMDLQGYSTQDISIRCIIPAYFPVLNYGIRYFLTPDVMEGLQSSLGLQYLEHNWEQSVIEFEGSAAGYQKLMEVLEGVSQEILVKETSGKVGNGVCPTCLVPIDSSMDFYRFQCGHVMCRQCANMKISTMDVREVKCAEESCETFVTPLDILNIISGSFSSDHDTARLHPLILKCKAAILASSERKICECTTRDCPGLRFHSYGNLLHYKSCTSCNQAYCRKCLSSPHRPHSCEQWAELQREEPAMQEYLDTEGKGRVKKCPMCSSLVEKLGDGCSHMECKCGCHFCWRCLYYVTKVEGPNPIYKHMKEEHREDPLVDPIQLAAEDLDIQDLLVDEALRHHRPQPPTRHLPDESDDDSDDDSDRGWNVRMVDEGRQLQLMARQLQDRLLIRQREHNRQVMARAREWDRMQARRGRNHH